MFKENVLFHWPPINTLRTILERGTALTHLIPGPLDHHILVYKNSVQQIQIKSRGCNHTERKNYMLRWATPRHSNLNLLTENYKQNYLNSTYVRMNPKICPSSWRRIEVVLLYFCTTLLAFFDVCCFYRFPLLPKCIGLLYFTQTFVLAIGNVTNMQKTYPTHFKSFSSFTYAAVPLAFVSALVPLLGILP